MKNIDSNRFKIRKPPMPAKKTPFHWGKMISDATLQAAMSAMRIQRMVKILFCLFISLQLFFMNGGNSSHLF